MNINKSQKKKGGKEVFLKYIMPYTAILLTFALSVVYTECRTARAEKKSGEVKLSVTLDKLENTATTSQLVIPDTEAFVESVIAAEPGLPSGDYKLQSSLSTFQLVSNEVIPVYTITNLGKRPVNISNISYIRDGEDTYWNKGWWDATGDTLINPPYHFHLNPDTAIRLTTKYPIDTIGINIHSIRITLASGEVKEFAPQWREEEQEETRKKN